MGRAAFFATFLGLPVGVYAIFVVWPFAQSFYYALMDWSGFSPDLAFIGLDNFRRLASDDLFLTALRNNVILTLVVPVATVVLSLALAVLVTVGGSRRGAVRGVVGGEFYQTVSMLPYVIPAIVVGLIWAQIFDPSDGLLNETLTRVGVDGAESFPWLGDRRTAMAASIAVIVWSMVGFYTVLFVAAIRGLPEEIFEAARLDGAGRFRTSAQIVMPLIVGSVRAAYVYLGVLAMDAFVYMAVLNPLGGPDNTTLVMPQRLLQVAFRQGQFGYASAMGVVISVVTLLFAGLVTGVIALIQRLQAGPRW